MAHRLLFLALLLINIYYCKAQCGFKPLGPENSLQASCNRISDLHMQMGPDNTPYALFIDGELYEEGNAKPSIRKYNGDSWVNVGTRGFTPGFVQNLSMAIASDGTIFVSFTEYSSNSTTSVMKYNGTDWVFVGARFFSNTFANSTYIALDNNDIPYVLYSDYSNILYVQKFNGSSWVNIYGPQTTAPMDAKLLIDASNSPCIAYQESYPDGKLSVSRYNGTSWINLGSKSFSSEKVYEVSFAEDNTGNLYVGYPDKSNNDAVTVKKFNGTNWTTVGSTGFTSTDVSGISLAFNASDVPYVGFVENSSLDNRGSVMMYDGSSWNTIGIRGVTSSIGFSSHLLIDQNANTIYMGYLDLSNGYKLGAFKYSQNNWSRLGTVGFANMRSDDFTVAINSAGILYVALKDNWSRVVVMNYMANNWSVVGNSGFSNNLASFVSLAINKMDVPYVAYQDGIDGKITVQKFNGTTWEIVGLAQFSSGKADHISISFNKDGAPYVVFSDYTKNQKLTVMKFQDNAWEIIGSSGFTQSYSFYPTLAFNSLGIPFVIFNDSGFGRGNAYKFNGTSWIATSLNAITDVSINNFRSAVFDSNDNLFVVYVDLNKKIALKKYNGSSWSTFSTSNFTSNVTRLIRLGIDHNDAFYVSYNNSDSYDRANLIQFKNNNWTSIGNPFTVDYVKQLDLVISETNVPYLAFYSSNAFAYRYDCEEIVTTNENKTTSQDYNTYVVYPNPSNGVFSIELKLDAPVAIYNSLGQLVLNLKLEAGFNKLDLSSQPTGMYILKVLDNNKTTKSIRLIKEN